jgi:hypothetical protein
MLTTLFDATAKTDNACSKKKTRNIDNFISPGTGEQLSGNEHAFARRLFCTSALDWHHLGPVAIIERK